MERIQKKMDLQKIIQKMGKWIQGNIISYNIEHIVLSYICESANYDHVLYCASNPCLCFYMSFQINQFFSTNEKINLSKAWSKWSRNTAINVFAVDLVSHEPCSLYIHIILLHVDNGSSKWPRPLWDHETITGVELGVRFSSNCNQFIP